MGPFHSFSLMQDKKLQAELQIPASPDLKSDAYSFNCIYFFSPQ